MLSVILWRWGRRYSVEFPNRMRRMLARHLRIQHVVYCVTDDPTGLDPEIVPVPMWDPEGLGRARRLRIFDPDVQAALGTRFLLLDIDGVIVDDLTPLVDRHEPFVLWRSPPELRYVGNAAGGALRANPESKRCAYNTSIVLMDAGIFPTLWADYRRDAAGLERAAQKASVWTSLYDMPSRTVKRLLPGDDDQAIVSLYALPRDPPIWGEADGVYKWGRRGFKDRAALPANARIVFMNGSLDVNLAGYEDAAAYPWIAAHWK